MPANKAALLRYRIIDNCLTNTMHKYPTFEFIKERIEEQIGKTLSDSMLTKDFAGMRQVYEAPIEYNRSKGGYWYTQEGFSIKEFPLTHEEIEALDYSTALLQILKHTKLFDQFESAINKVTQGYRISEILGKSETQILQVEEPSAAGGNNWLQIILKSIVEKQCLLINYQGYGREEKQHEFSPYLLKEYRNRWYTIGYSLKADNILVLALDRINDLQKCKAKYKTNNNFTPADFFKYSFGITQINEGVPQVVELLFTPFQAPYIIGQPLHHSQEILSNDGKGLLVQVNIYLTYELTMAILAFGAEVKILKPLQLVKEVRKLIGNMSKVYK